MYRQMETPENTTVRPPGDWYCCSRCGQKLFKVLPGAEAKGIMIKCKKCREIIEINIGMSRRA